MAIIIQKDATIYRLFVSVNCSTCFVWYLHPSSGAHVTVSTVSGIIETVTAACCERDCMGTGQFPSNTFATGSSNGFNNVRYRYSDMSSWWWVEIPPETCRAVTDINKLYIVASCWTITDTYYTMHGPLNIKFSDGIAAPTSGLKLGNCWIWSNSATESMAALGARITWIYKK